MKSDRNALAVLRNGTFEGLGALGGTSTYPIAEFRASNPEHLLACTTSKF